MSCDFIYIFLQEKKDYFKKKKKLKSRQTNSIEKVT